jgi:hypothetical protein
MSALRADQNETALRSAAGSTALKNTSDQSWLELVKSVAKNFIQRSKTRRTAQKNVEVKLRLFEQSSSTDNALNQNTQTELESLPAAGVEKKELSRLASR